MIFKKIPCLSLALFVFVAAMCFAADSAILEKIVYKIKPLGGRAEYMDYGVVDWNGQKVNKVIFHTRTVGFEDTETIYSRLEDFLPIRVERDILKLIGGEFITEDYDQEKYTEILTKYKKRGGKKIRQEVFKADGPIHNAVLMMFKAGQIFEFTVGWREVFWVPDRFELTLASIDKIVIYDKTYEAYHFTSKPNMFELWISKDEPRIPLLIKGKGDFKYKFVLKEYHAPVHES